MKAVVTNKNNEYNYTIENVTVINYVEKMLIIVFTDETGTHTSSYSSDEVIIAIA